jgi:hypothetical protein
VITDHTQNNQNAVPQKWTGQIYCLTPSKNVCPLYSQENEVDPMVVCKFFDPVGSWTWYAYEGSPVDEDGYYDTDKEKVDYMFSGMLWGSYLNLDIFR